jgi:hypothetical protein
MDILNLEAMFASAQRCLRSKLCVCGEIDNPDCERCCLIFALRDILNNAQVIVEWWDKPFPKITTENGRIHPSFIAANRATETLRSYLSDSHVAECVCVMCCGGKRK